MVASLRLLREELDRMTVERGITRVSPSVCRLRDALQKMIEQENRLNDYLAKQPGAQPEPRSTLTLLRHEIGCKLARLRACCQEGEVPG